MAWRCAQDLRAAYRAKSTLEGKARAEKILQSFHTCPIPEVARMGRTLRRWREAFLAHFYTERRTTAAPRRSMASSNSTDASRASTATPTTAASECSSLAAASRSDPHRIGEEPAKRHPRPTMCSGVSTADHDRS